MSSGFFSPGSVVRWREREWVLLPSESDEVWALRPLTGTEDDVVMVHKRLSNLAGYDLPAERVELASFPLPTLEDFSDAASVHLLWQAARLILREGATPLRSLGRISIRPRVYQFVPLLMALRLNPVRLFIADDVGVGKTIEALLVARELLDRGEIRRLCVLCPPYLCDQWERELSEKFGLEAVVIRSGTVGRLERQVPAGKCIYEYFPILVASIDFVKTDRNRHLFLRFCPELVIVDEVHGAAEAYEKAQQERHALLCEIAKDPNRHLIMLTATPHCGIEEAFRSLLALLRPEFGEWKISELAEQQRIILAQHFVQRTRRDIEQVGGQDICFPTRETEDETYALSPRYYELYKRTYDFCFEIVRTAERLEEHKRRMRYWGALALMRCVMSSPAAAFEALEKRARAKGRTEEGEESSQDAFVGETSEERADDEVDTYPIEAAEASSLDSDRYRLRKLADMAKELCGSQDDTKLEQAKTCVEKLLRDGFHPIVWCRYVATAEYVAEHLRRHLPSDVQVVCVTGRMGDEEREAKINEIDAQQPRVLVATDCLSEGINLQEKFSAVLHYDLPWNPNRLEQREGRVDRYGQPKQKVKAVQFIGRDNPVDGVVIEVLLDKAREIHRTLGTYVPVPEQTESVMQAMLEALFFRRKRDFDGQQELDLDARKKIVEFHRLWERDAERERINRTRFAQRALKPEEVQREVEATDKVLGDPDAVRDFVLSAAQRLGLPITKDPKRPGVWQVSLDPLSLTTVPEPIRSAIPGQSPLAPHHSPFGIRHSSKPWLVSFQSPTPEGAEYLGRNHRFVAAMARFLFEESLTKREKATASRCGALRTRAVSILTTLYLLRVRYLLEQPERRPLLSEEVLVLGAKETSAGAMDWLDESEATRLLAEAKPDANIPLQEKRELVKRALEMIGKWRLANGEWGKENEIQAAIRGKIESRAQSLLEAHKRIRRAVSMRVRELKVVPQFPPDLLGILVLQPMVEP